MKRRILLALVIGLALASPADARADMTPDLILRDLAANQTHSWTMDGIGHDAMVAKYEAGERLYVTCGHVAEVARRLLRQAGYPARVVQSLTLGPWDYLTDGHLMTEVFVDGRWQLYDLDANVRAVDADGVGVSLVEQVKAVREGTARWEPIADDALFLETEPDAFLRELARDIFTDPAAFYTDVMGIPLLPRDPAGTVNHGMYFHDGSQVRRLAAYRHGWRFFASDAAWEVLTRSPNPPPAEPAPTAAPPGTSPPVVPPPVAVQPLRAVPVAAVPARALTPPACQLRGRRVSRRGVSCQRARNVLLRYLRSGKGGAGWECRSGRCRRGRWVARLGQNP